MTGQDLLNSALRLLGVQAVGESTSADEAADGLVILQNFIDTLQAQAGAIYSVVRNTYNLTANTQTYTLGTAGTLATTRPAKIEAVSIIDTTNASQPVEIPIKYITSLEWQQESVKNNTVQIPYEVWDDQGFPTRTLTYNPIPSVSCQTAIYSWSPLTTFSDLVTDTTFPPGYLEAIKYNLALRLAPEFGVINIPAMILKIADEGMDTIKRMNFRPLDVAFDPLLPGLRNSARKSDIFTGDV